MDRNELLKYVEEQFGTEPEYLWSSFPNYFVLRHETNRKWYAAVMDVPREKLGLSGEGRVDILNAKCGQLLSDYYLKIDGIMPSYHMNKSNWVSALLDGTVPRVELIGLLSLSYDLTRGM